MRNLAARVLLVSVATLTISIVPAFAQGHGRGHENNDRQEHGEHGRGHQQHRDNRGHRDYFIDNDRDMIVSYYRNHQSYLPPGLARREELPPGLERHLQRDGELPPGLRKRIVWFPPELDRQLGPLPEGYRRCWVGNDALIVNVQTFAISDVMLGFSLVVH